MLDNDDNKQSFASPFGAPPEEQDAEAWQVTEQPIYARPSTAEAPYTQEPLVTPAFSQPTFAQPAYAQQYGPSPYAQFEQAQMVQQPEEPGRKKEKKRKDGSGSPGIGRKNMAALIVIIILACLGSAVGGGYIGASMNSSSPVIINQDSSPSVVIQPGDDTTTTEAVAKKVLSSVVGITSTGRISADNGYFGQTDGEISGVGTGMIIDTSGFILTNSHVVLDGMVDMIEVLLSSGEEADGTLIWNDPGLDLAIIKIEVLGLVPVELGDSDNVLIGSYAAAVGNPLGLQFSGSITAGVVSGLDRTITVANSMGGGTTTMQGLIQVDAAINSGNSGGPLLNSRGQVIGINTAKATAEGMGFAIPINTAIPIVEKVIRDGSFERVFMGVSAADVQVIRDNYPNVELFTDSGACITDVNPGSPAEKGGLKVKDVITAIDGKEVTGSDSLIKMLLNYTSGDVISVTFNREGEVMETQVTLLSQAELDRAQQEENPFMTPDRNNAGR